MTPALTPEQMSSILSLGFYPKRLTLSYYPAPMLNQTQRDAKPWLWQQVNGDGDVEGHKPEARVRLWCRASHQYGGDKLVEEDHLDAADGQADRGVHHGHVQVGIALRGVRIVDHTEGKHLLIRYGHRLQTTDVCKQTLSPAALPTTVLEEKWSSQCVDELVVNPLATSESHSLSWTYLYRMFCDDLLFNYPFNTDICVVK